MIRTNDITRMLLVFGLSLVTLLGSSGSARAEFDRLPAALHSPAQRTSDEVIASDLAAIDGCRTALQVAAQKGGPQQQPWRQAFANAWLDAARTEYTDHDRTGFAEGAYQRALAILREIESGAAPVTHESVPVAADSIRGSMKVREELWKELERLKRHEGFKCAEVQIARLEVQLAWTGNEQVDMGDCHASPHLAEAQRLATEARSLEEVCNVAPPPVAAKPVPVEAPKPVVPTREELKIPRNVHFALDKHFISAESRRVIEGIAALLNKYPSIKVRLEGHTDSRASVAYNLALSQRRVNATRAVFLELGIDSTRMSIDFKGKGDLYAEEKDTRGFALNRRVEMVFVDPDGRDIQSERQEGDLQLEGATPVKPKAPAVRRKPAAAAKPGAPKPATPKP